MHGKETTLSVNENNLKMVVEHPMLLTQPKNREKTLLYRLVNDLQVSELEFLRCWTLSAIFDGLNVVIDWEQTFNLDPLRRIKKPEKESDESWNERNKLRQEMVEMMKLSWKESLQCIADYIFMISLGDSFDSFLDGEWRFDNVDEFCFPIIAPAIGATVNVSLWMKPRSEPMLYVSKHDEEIVIPLWIKPRSDPMRLIKMSTTYYNGLCLRYDVKQEQSVQIDREFRVKNFDKTYGTGGSIEIRSSSDIHICPNGKIIGDSSWWRGDGATIILMAANDVEIDMNAVVRCYGREDPENESKKKKLKDRSKKSRAEFYEGNGGTIYIICGGRLVNRGTLECMGKDNGRIVIHCREYVNEGTIYPQPEVSYYDDVSYDITSQRMWWAVLTQQLWRVLQYEDSDLKKSAAMWTANDVNLKMIAEHPLLMVKSKTLRDSGMYISVTKKSSMDKTLLHRLVNDLKIKELQHLK